MRTYVFVCVAFCCLIACSSHDLARGLPDATAGHGTTDDAEEVSCFDGVDNDRDGLVDCADPGCAAVASCVAEIPDGWTGHAMLYDGDPASPPAGCSGVWTNELVAGRSAPSGTGASCSACGCASPSGGSCAAVGGDATVSPPSAARVGIACTMAATEPAAGCTAGACLPTPAGDYVTGLCIYHSGEVACPAGAFGDRHVFYAGTLDTRGCEACACGAPTAGACAASGGEPTGGVAGMLSTMFCCASQP